MTILTVENLRKSFGDRVVLDSVNFSLEEGEVVFLFGPNGSGKSTLLNILSGLTLPDAGSVCNEREHGTQRKRRFVLGAGIARTFQNVRLVEDLSASENLILSQGRQRSESWWWSAIYPNRVKLEYAVCKERALEQLRRVDMLESFDQLAGTLSFGQQKLLSLAMALMNKPALVFLDEPVAGVNQSYLLRIQKIILDAKNTGTTFLIVEHNKWLIESLADRVLFLDRGFVANFSSYNQLEKSEGVRKAYI